MAKVNIQTMTPKAILHKEAFKRALPSAQLSQAGVIRRTIDCNSTVSLAWDELKYEEVTQQDFIREFYVNAHPINSIKYYHNPITKDTENKIYQKIKTRTAIAWQERIFTKRLTTLTGNNVSLRSSNASASKETSRSLLLFREGWEVKNIENALFEAISADGKTGDCAINFYLDKGRCGWRAFSFEKGDVLYPHYDPLTGRLALFGRRYYAHNYETDRDTLYLDVWDDEFYARYRFSEKAEGGNDDWIIDEEPYRHNFDRIPIAYDRYGEPFWANSESLIEAHEMAMSQLCENNMAYALRILYTFGASMQLKTNMDGTPEQISGVSPDSKVGYLEPADSSKSFELQISALEKNIMRCSFAVETPEIKSGADMSSLTVKMLFADSYQKALEDAMHFQPFLDDVVELFKYAYGIAIGRSSDFNVLKVKGEIMPYIFMSDQEVVTNTVQGVNVRALSRKAANQQFYQMGYCEVDDYQQMLQEEHDEIAGTVTTTATNVVNAARNAQ